MEKKESDVSSLTEYDKEKIVRLYAQKRPVSLSVSLSILMLSSVGIIPDHDTTDYLAKIAERSTELKSRFGVHKPKG